MSASTQTKPTQEKERVALVASLGLIDTPNEPEFDLIASEAARLTGYDTALVTFMDADRCWFKAVAGILSAPGIPREIPRGLTYCQHALGSSGFFVITDGLQDPRVSQLVSVNGPGGFRAYAGIQLILPEGLSVGSLCVLNRTPRTPTAQHQATLRRLADQTLQLIAQRRKHTKEAGAHRDLLLITDDDEGIRGFLADLFAIRGMRSLTAGSGKEALRLYEENASRIALVLTDFNMPGINGLELIRALSRLPHPPRCVVMSGHLSDRDRLDLAAAGVGLILNKPFSRFELEALAGLVASAVPR